MCYELMCCLFLDCGNPEYSFGHCFLTLEWNLMSDIEGKALQKIDSRIMMEPDLVSTSAIGIVTAPSPPTAVANEATTIFIVTLQQLHSISILT